MPLYFVRIIDSFGKFEFSFLDSIRSFPLWGFNVISFLTSALFPFVLLLSLEPRGGHLPDISSIIPFLLSRLRDFVYFTSFLYIYYTPLLFVVLFCFYWVVLASGSLCNNSPSRLLSNTTRPDQTDLDRTILKPPLDWNGCLLNIRGFRLLL